MANRKAALVGCAEGPWVSTGDLENPHAEVKLPDGAEVEIQHHDTDEVLRISSAGVHPIASAMWTRVVVTRGDCRAVLVSFVSRRVRDAVA